jgi:hypothetical protein
MKYTIFLTILLSILLIVACKESFLDSLDLPDEVEFTHLPTDLSQMLEFGPMGQIRVIPKMHGGFRLKQPFTFPATIPVYAMGDGYIINIKKESRTVPGHGPLHLVGREYDDFGLDMVYTKDAGGYYGHVSALHEKILEQAGEIRHGRGARNEVKIKISAGQILGYIGPHEGFDIGMYDYSRENYFANPSMYGRDYRSSVCYTDYLPEALKQEIWAINPRTAEPRCGNIAYDKDGTLAGNWFLEGTKDITEWSKQLIFARHEIHGDRIAIVDASPLFDGDGIINDGIDAYLWFVKGNNPEPENITMESGIVAYEVARAWVLIQNEHAEPDGALLIQMLEPEKIQYEYFEGKRAGEVSGFSSNARIYVR